MVVCGLQSIALEKICTMFIVQSVVTKADFRYLFDEEIDDFVEPLNSAGIWKF